MKTIFAFLFIAVCTVGLYYLLFDEHSTLLYVNVCTACITEGILCLSIPMLADERLLTFKRAASQYILVTYSILIFLWTTGYTLFMSESDSIKYLYVGLLVISVVFIFLLIVTEVGGDAMRKKEETLQATIRMKKQTILSLENFWFEVQNELCNHSDWENETLHTLRATLDKIASIPVEKWERNEDIAEEVNRRLSELGNAISAAGANVAEEEKQLAVTNLLNRLRNYVVTLKSTL